MSDREIEPRKENRAFAVWVILALIVLGASIYVVTGVLHTVHAPVAPGSEQPAR